MMIDYFLSKVPTTLVGHDDFPYLKSYFEYIIDSIPGATEALGKNEDCLKIIDSPYCESFILESAEDFKIVFDVSFSLTLIEFNAAIIRGEITEDFWHQAIHTIAGFLLANKKENLALPYAFRNLHDEEMKHIFSNNKTILEMKGIGLGPEFKEKMQSTLSKSANIQIQEFFILGHEICHLMISKQVLEFDSIIDVFVEDTLERGYTSLSDSVFFDEIFGKKEIEDVERNKQFLLFKAFLNDKSFKIELTCDIIASELALEYFTWDAGTFEKGTVANAIRTCMRSIYLIEQLRSLTKNRFLEERNNKWYVPHQIFLRTKFLDAHLSNKIKGSLIDVEKPIFSLVDQIFKHDIKGYEYIRKRAYCIDEVVLQKLVSDAEEISRNYQSISEYFKTPFEASIYFMGHDIKKTYETNFMQNDATLFLRDEEAKCYIADLCKLKEPFFSEEQKSRAKEIMDTPIY